MCAVRAGMLRWGPPQRWHLRSCFRSASLSVREYSRRPVGLEASWDSTQEASRKKPSAVKEFLRGGEYERGRGGERASRAGHETRDEPRRGPEGRAQHAAAVSKGSQAPRTRQCFLPFIAGESKSCGGGEGFRGEIQESVGTHALFLSVDRGQHTAVASPLEPPQPLPFLDSPG